MMEITLSKLSIGKYKMILPKGFSEWQKEDQRYIGDIESLKSRAYYDYSGKDLGKTKAPKNPGEKPLWTFLLRCYNHTYVRRYNFSP